MGRLQHFDSMDDFRDAHMTGLLPGVAAFHAQLYPGMYPGDQPYVDALRADPHAPPLVGPAFMQHARELKDAGVLLQRLTVVHGPGEEEYDPAYIRILQATELQTAHLEDTRVAWYGRQAARLALTGGSPSGLNAQYRAGVASHTPKASFWGLYPHEAATEPSMIGMMDYADGSRDFEGITAWEPPLDQDMLLYTRFWRRVFLDLTQQTPIGNLELPDQ